MLRRLPSQAALDAMRKEFKDVKGVDDGVLIRFLVAREFKTAKVARGSREGCE